MVRLGEETVSFAFFRCIFASNKKMSHFYGKICSYVVIYRNKDKDTTQTNLAEQ